MSLSTVWIKSKQLAINTVKLQPEYFELFSNADKKVFYSVCQIKLCFDFKWNKVDFCYYFRLQS